MTDPSGTPLVPPIRRNRAPIAEQISSAIKQAIIDGRLAPDTRLPSSRDLSVQLGVARGTVRNAFEQLAEDGFVAGAGAAGTWVRAAVGTWSTKAEPERHRHEFRRPMEGLVPAFSSPPLPFQMGVPANDAFPAKAWQRARMKALRDDNAAPASYPDPRGEPQLRTQIASQLAIGRGLHCDPDQIVITTGYRQGLALVLLALDVHGQRAWMEEPGFPIGRRALELAGLSVVPVPVDAQGLRVDAGIGIAPDAAIALVTPGQQAPLGMALNPSRRQELLTWAAERGAWIIEDDYLSELQLEGRAAPALAMDEDTGRVVHLGTFSKTLAPSLGLGFVVAPVQLVDRITEAAAMMMPAPDRTVQHALAAFMAGGYYSRHLRHTKLLYRARAASLRTCLRSFGFEPLPTGLAMLLRLPDRADDIALSLRGLGNGIAPAPLSAWFAAASCAGKGPLLNVTNVREDKVADAVHSLSALLAPERGE